MIRLIALGLLLCAGAAGAETLAIVHATAHTGAAAPVTDATIVAADGRIVSIARGGASPAGARVVDARGRVVTVGLMNAGTQLALEGVAGAKDTNDQSVALGPLGAAFAVEAAIDPDSPQLAQARADGVTRAISYPGASNSTEFSGTGAVLRLLDGPGIVERPHAAMFAVVGHGGIARAGGSRAAQWLLIRNALDEARRLPPGLAARDQLLARIDLAALKPVLAGAMPLVIEANRASDLRQAIRLASEQRVRVVVLGGAEAWRVAGELAAARIPVILDPMLNLPLDFDRLGARLDNAALLQRAGVTIAFTAPGFGIHRSYNAGLALREGAGIAVANGLAYGDALRAITANPARIFGLDGRYGTLAPGMDADLVMWDGDPLEPSSAPAAVWMAGREVSLETRQTALRDRYAPARAADPLPAVYR